MIKFPPQNESFSSVMDELNEKKPEKLSEYLEYYNPVDKKGRYLPFDEFRHRVKSGLDINMVWAITKSSRKSQCMKMLNVGEIKEKCSFILTPTIQKTISNIDRYTSTGALESMSRKIGEEKHFKYLLNNLIEDEAISSSQLEGAATTTLVAKDMLKKKRKPRSPDEKMIVGNFKMMTFAWENRSQPLSIELILNMHNIGTENIDNDKYTPGVFRKTDDVFVVNSDGETVHTPPGYKGIKNRLKSLIEWANTCHDDANGSEYIHPAIKAISLHFAIGYEHPFRDGNGRVARSLFYWYMFKNSYAAFRYIAISTLLKAAPVKYGNAYLYTETDEMDLTYFVDYQCEIILRAINNFKQACKVAVEDMESFNRWIFDSGLYQKLSEKQRIIFAVARNGSEKYFTSTQVKDNLGCSYNTASTALKGLVELNVFEKKKVGQEWFYFMLGKKSIKNNWIIG